MRPVSVYFGVDNWLSVGNTGSAAHRKTPVHPTSHSTSHRSRGQRQMRNVTELCESVPTPSRRPRCRRRQGHARMLRNFASSALPAFEVKPWSHGQPDAATGSIRTGDTRFRRTADRPRIAVTSASDWWLAEDERCQWHPRASVRSHGRSPDGEVQRGPTSRRMAVHNCRACLTDQNHANN
jgi:hypothetical protein